MTELRVRTPERHLLVYWCHPWVKRLLSVAEIIEAGGNVKGLLQRNPRTKVVTFPKGEHFTSLVKLSRCIIVEPKDLVTLVGQKPRVKYLGTAEYNWLRSLEGETYEAVRLNQDPEVGREYGRRRSLRQAMKDAKLSREERGAIWDAYFEKFHSQVGEAVHAVDINKVPGNSHPVVERRV